jgi:hypothetical protein
MILKHKISMETIAITIKMDEMAFDCNIDALFTGKFEFLLFLSMFGAPR